MKWFLVNREEKMSKVESRLEALRTLSSDPWYKKQLRKISETEFDQIVEFIEDQGESNFDEYAMECRRIHLDGKVERTKNWTIVQEICEVVGSIQNRKERRSK